MANKAENMNDAIVDSVRRVLDNTKFMTDASIKLEYHQGEVPFIRYEIREAIVPDDYAD